MSTIYVADAPCGRCFGFSFVQNRGCAPKLHSRATTRPHSHISLRLTVYTCIISPQKDAIAHRACYSSATTPFDRCHPTKQQQYPSPPCLTSGRVCHLSWKVYYSIIAQFFDYLTIILILLAERTMRTCGTWIGCG